MRGPSPISSGWPTWSSTSDHEGPVTPLYSSRRSRRMRKMRSSPLCRSWPNSGKGRNVSKELLVAVIDDDEPFRTALVESLASLGYRAGGFASAEEFLAADARSSYDCVITDIHMPGMSGLD